MSGNNFTCRDKYYNYGSYLRSRGYDKEICSLVTDIENGNIPIGPITPGNCGSSKPTIIEGNVTIKKCITDPSSGILRVNGGVIVDDTGGLSDTSLLGLQVQNGAYISGPIYQTTDCSHSNYFSAGNHIFQGGTWGNDCSTNVIINGDFSVTGDVSYNKLTVFDLSVTNVLTVGTSTTYIDTSSVITTELSANQIDVNTLQASEISCTGNIEITGGGKFIGDLSSVQLTDLSNSVTTNETNIADISATILGYNTSFNTQNLTVTNLIDASSIDISNNVNFTQNPIITNVINATHRTLVNFGETITVLDASDNLGLAGPHDISFNILYSNIDNSSNIFQDNKIDFSNNQAYFENSILEVSYSVNANFSSVGPANALTVSLKEVGGSSIELFLDTRTIEAGLGARKICFGPQTFIFKNGYTDNDHIEKEWTLHYDITGGPIPSKEGRLTIKQKSLV
jgi:hypothetical protein